MPIPTSPGTSDNSAVKRLFQKLLVCGFPISSLKETVEREG